MRFGADYYPEQWTEKDWDEDLVLMKWLEWLNLLGQ